MLFGSVTVRVAGGVWCVGGTINKSSLTLLVVGLVGAGVSAVVVLHDSSFAVGCGVEAVLVVLVVTDEFLVRCWVLG